MFKNEADFEKTVSRLKIDDKPNLAHRERLRREMLSVFDEIAQQSREQATPHGALRRVIVRSPVTQMTAAALIVISVVFLIASFHKAASPAYALEQTIKAKRIIKTVHLRKYEQARSIESNEFSDYWLKYDDTGKLTNLRRNEYSKNRVKFIVWNEGIKKTWILQDNVVIVQSPNSNTAKEWDGLAKAFDYEFLLKWLNDRKEKEEIELEITDEPAQDSDFIYVKAVHSGEEERVELVIDRKTKLIKRFSKYHLAEGGDELGEQIEFFSYNQLSDPSTFELKGIPANAKVID